MKWIINLIGKWTGVSKLIAAIDGYKSKAAGLVGFLTGLAGVISEAIKITDLAGALAFIKGLPADANWLAMLAGLAILGIAGKIEKAAQPKP